MRFNSVHFLIFFPIVVLGYFVVPKKIKNLWLLIASYYFYMSWKPVYALLIFFSTLSTYLRGLAIDKSKSKAGAKAVLTVNIIINIAILFYFKYFNFFIEIITSLVPGLQLQQNNNLLAVVGISFYTFQSLGYSIDVYRKKVPAEKNFLTYALFVSFFPQLVAGPIERSENLLPQLKKTYKFDYGRVTDGLVLMAWGFFKKMVIADGCGKIVDVVFNNISSYGGLQFMIAAVLFAFQIYGDFSGYSDIAIGAANVIGIKLMKNFDHPYFAQNPVDFWRRWHISLSGWFMDYIYIPLGGSRKGKLRTAFNLMVTFLVSGLWHGANLTYVVWGGINGLYNIIYRFMPKPKNKIKRLAPLKILGTFLLVDFSWIFFRAANLSDAVYIVKSLGGVIPGLLTKGALTARLESVSFFSNNGVALVCCLLFMLAVEIWENKSSIVEKINDSKWPVRWAFYYAVVLLILFFGNFGQSRFIYFQF